MNYPLLLRTNIVSTDPNKKKPVRDPLLRGDNGGVLVDFDLGFDFSYPGTLTNAAPVSGTAVKDIAERSADLVWNMKAGQSVAYAGKSVDFSGATDDPISLNAAAGVLSSIWASANQYFMVVMYGKLPTAADWSTGTSIHSMFSCLNAVSHSVTGAADLVTIGQYPTNQLLALRQTNGATIVQSTLVLNSAVQGKFCQIAYARQASGVFLRVRSADGELVTNGSVGVNNTTNFAACQPQFGLPDPYNTLSTTPAQRTGANRRLSRGFIENLALSGRDAVAVANADWDRVIARGIFS